MEPSRAYQIIGNQQRFFFSKKEDKKDNTADSTAKTTDKKEEPKKEDPKETAKSDDKKQDNKTDRKSQADSDTSSSSSGEEDSELSREDVKKIKQLITDQDKEIETLKQQVKQFKEKYMYQVAENDNTIKRYLKEIDNTKEFAITKFAKELLDVRDSLDLAFQYIKKIQVTEETPASELRTHFEQIAKGMEMTNTVMDKVLSKFGVVQVNPLGEKFDPNSHEAVYVVQDDTKVPGTVATVMQTGWKIGDRNLRAAKVGIVKKN